MSKSIYVGEDQNQKDLKNEYYRRLSLGESRKELNSLIETDVGILVNLRWSHEPIWQNRNHRWSNHE